MLSKLKMMRDISCFPIWTYDSPELINIDPKSLPISEELIIRLKIWADHYDKKINLHDPYDVFNTPSEDSSSENEEEKEGLELWADLAHSLSGKYEVYYFYQGKILTEPSQHPLAKT